MFFRGVRRHPANPANQVLRPKVRLMFQCHQVQ